MRRIVTALVIAVTLSLLTGCMLIQMSKKASVPEVGVQVPEKKVAVVGKITYNPEPKQEIKPGSVWERMYGRKMTVGFGREFNGKEKLDAFADVSWDEYFVLLLPRKETTLVFSQTALESKGNTQKSLHVFWRQKIPVKPEDCAVYIGDIEVQFDVPNALGGKDHLIVVTDRFEDAKRKLDEFELLDSSSRPVTLTRRLATGEDKAEVKMLVETIRYR